MKPVSSFELDAALRPHAQRHMVSLDLSATRNDLPPYTDGRPCPTPDVAKRSRANGAAKDFCWCQAGNDTNQAR